MNNKSGWNSPLAIAVILWILASLTISEVYFYSRHTLEMNGHWKPTKLFSIAGLLGTMEYATDRQALALDRLNLDAWHGFQEVTYDTPLPIEHLDGDITLGDAGYLNVILRPVSGQGPAVGFRLSRNERFPPITFSVNEDGKFIDRSIVPGFASDKSRMVFSLSKKGPDISISVDGRPFALLNSPNKEYLLSFRGGANPAAINELRIKASQNEFVENFHPKWNSIVALKTALALAFLSMLFILLPNLKFSGRKQTSRRLMKWCLIQFVFLILGMGYWTFDYFYWTALYPYHMASVSSPQKKQGNSISSMLETGRKIIFNVMAEFLENNSESETNKTQSPTRRRPFSYAVNSDDMAEIFSVANLSQLQSALPLHQTLHRILWLGASQTWGAGTTQPKQSFACQFVFGLNRKGKEKYCGLNLALPGMTSIQELNLLKEFASVWKPDFVLINLAKTGPEAQFVKNLAEIVQFVRTLGGIPIFVLEPNTTEGNSKMLLQHANNLQIVTAFAKTQSVRVLNMDNYFRQNDVYDSGFIWWDNVHLTNYGHQLAAHWLVEQFNENLNSH